MVNGLDHKDHTFSKNVSYTNAQIQIHKYTNTAYGEVPEDPTCSIFLKRGLFKDIKNDISMCQTCKYKYKFKYKQKTQRFYILQLYLQCFHASIFSLFPVAAKILAFQGGTKDYLKQGEGEFRRGRDKLR